MEKGIKIPMDVEGLVSGINEIDKGASNIYLVPKSDNDINLFKEVYESFSMYDEDSGNVFKELVYKNNKDIEELNDMAQQILISYSLINYMLKLKSDRNDVTMLEPISSIKYGLDRKDWLFLMKERVIPYLATNKLL